MRDVLLYVGSLAILCTACIHDLGVEVTPPGPAAAEAAAPAAAARSAVRNGPADAVQWTAEQGLLAASAPEDGFGAGAGACELRPRTDYAAPEGRSRCVVSSD
jgi:hypothetical protein